MDSRFFVKFISLGAAYTIYAKGARQIFGDVEGVKMEGTPAFSGLVHAGKAAWRRDK